MKYFFILHVFLYVNYSFSTDDTKITNYPVIHVFGDSHVGSFMYIKGCKLIHIGYPMYHIGKHKLDLLDFKKHGVLDGEVTICVFGEHDVRGLIGKLRDESKKEIGEVIDNLVEKYIDVINLNRSFYDNLFCIVYSVVPPTSWKGGMPCCGTLEERVLITKLLNQKLSEICSKNNISFLDIFDDYANPDGTLCPSLSDGGVHLHGFKTQPIKDKLYKILKDNNLI